MNGNKTLALLPIAHHPNDRDSVRQMGRWRERKMEHGSKTGTWRKWKNVWTVIITELSREAVWNEQREFEVSKETEERKWKDSTRHLINTHSNNHSGPQKSYEMRDNIKWVHRSPCQFIKQIPTSLNSGLRVFLITAVLCLDFFFTSGFRYLAGRDRQRNKVMDFRSRCGKRKSWTDKQRQKQHYCKRWRSHL